MRRGGGRPPAYLTVDGKRVPSVTTILGRFKDSGGLIRWAYNCGRDGIDMDRARDDAASAGHIAHEFIDADIHGRPPRVPTIRDVGLDEQNAEHASAHALMIDRAYTALDAFREWRQAVAFEAIATELPLVSEKHLYGGCIDAVAKVGGKLAIVDWKTGNRMYPEHLVQVAAYRGLWEEHRPESIIETIHVLRVGKDMGDFHHHSWPIAVLNDAWRSFALMRELYDLDAKLKKAAA